MDEQHNPRKSELKFLERLSMEELEALLKFSGDPDDVELLFDTVVEEVIAREREKPTGRLPDVNAAWDEFQMMYQKMPDGEMLPPPSTEEAVSVSADENGSFPLAASATDRPGRISFLKVFRIAAVMAAAVVLSLALMVGVQAMGADVFGALARWTDDTFHFETHIDTKDEQSFLNNVAPNAFGTINISGEYMPTKCPNGFSLMELNATQSEEKTSVLASFSNESNECFYIRIDQYSQREDINYQTFEIEADSITEYTSRGKTFFIFSNSDIITAVWADGSSTLQRIWGELTIEELKTILDSIGDSKR